MAGHLKKSGDFSSIIAFMIRPFNASSRGQPAARLVRMVPGDLPSSAHPQPFYAVLGHLRLVPKLGGRG